MRTLIIFYKKQKSKKYIILKFIKVYFTITLFISDNCTINSHVIADRKLTDDEKE
jgi:hypothetical protein